jgi:hypothetical protein
MADPNAKYPAGTRIQLTRPVAGLMQGALGTVGHTPRGPHCDVIVAMDELAAVQPEFATICCYWNEIEEVGTDV